jgi:hypothetical protein
MPANATFSLHKKVEGKDYYQPCHPWHDDLSVSHAVHLAWQGGAERAKDADWAGLNKVVTRLARAASPWATVKTTRTGANAGKLWAPPNAVSSLAVPAAGSIRSAEAAPPERCWLRVP